MRTYLGSALSTATSEAGVFRDWELDHCCVEVRNWSSGICGCPGGKPVVHRGRVEILLSRSHFVGKPGKEILFCAMLREMQFSAETRYKGWLFPLWHLGVVGI